MEKFVAGVKFFFSEIPWMQVALVALGIYVAYLIFKFHRNEGNTYNVWDMVMSEGKADLYKHVVVVMAVLTCWTVVWLALRDKPVETLLLGGLGIFVGSRLVNSVASTLSNKPDHFYEGGAPPKSHAGPPKVNPLSGDVAIEPPSEPPR
jgi:hypothetical protein